MNNAPDVKMGIVAVSRDCFPANLSKNRSIALLNEYRELGRDALLCPTIVQDEVDVGLALNWLRSNNINAMLIYLGNFGPEGPETMLAQRFGQPVMFMAAAEETTADSLGDNRGDGFCGMLSMSYNMQLRGIRPYIPEYPVGTPDVVASELARFEVIARVLIGVKKLKIFTFGPRPFNFVACNAPIKPLYDLGVEIQENSELDLYDAFLRHENDPRINDIKAEMAAELDGRNDFPAVMDMLAQYELTLLDWLDENLGASEYGVFANKCWPAFQTMFKFVPCYVNSRLTAKGYPVACEVDAYGALTEYMLYLATGSAVTLLDINNTVPADMYAANKSLVKGYKHDDLFMGFHCGNTPVCNLKPKSGTLKYQRIMKRLLEPDSEPNFSRGTLDGNIKSGPVTLFRLQSSSDCKLRSYIAQGEVLDVDPCSFGGIGVIGVPEMARFYRHVMIQNQFPHHAGVGFANVGATMFEVVKLLGVEDIGFNQPAGMLYKTENPFAF